MSIMPSLPTSTEDRFRGDTSGTTLSFCYPWRPDSGNPCRNDEAGFERSGNSLTSFPWSMNHAIT